MSGISVLRGFRKPKNRSNHYSDLNTALRIDRAGLDR